MFGRVNPEEKAYADQVQALRQHKDHFFGSSLESPIPDDTRRRGFAGLSYFPPDLAFRVRAMIVPFQRQALVDLGTTTGAIRPQVRHAELRFRIGEQNLRLTGFLDPHYREHHHGQDHGVELFVPFRDASSGRETYGAGRYVEVQVEEEADSRQVATIDFNLAYNPFCAYNEAYSCPLPPVENALPVAIRAGERIYGNGH